MGVAGPVVESRGFKVFESSECQEQTEVANENTEEVYVNDNKHGHHSFSGMGQRSVC